MPPRPGEAPPLSHPTMRVSVSYCSYSSSSSSFPGASFTSASSSARATAVAAAFPKPSVKPPSLYHDYKGDVRAQDLFVEAFEAHRKEGQRHRILFPGSDRFELERMDVWNHDSICTPCLILQPRNSAEVASCVKGYASGVRRCLSENRAGAKAAKAAAAKAAAAAAKAAKAAKAAASSSPKLDQRTKSRAKAKNKAYADIPEKTKPYKPLGIPRLCVAGGRSSCSSMVEGAIVLDLSRMKRIKIEPDGRSVTVQGGARVADLDAVLGPRGLMAVTSTHPTVGVVGCVLGGGFGYASRKYGLACDNIIGAKIVTADGRVRRCGKGGAGGATPGGGGGSNNNNDDLFWAVRGGGGGIGIVTEMTLRCYPLRNAALLTFDLVASTLRVRKGIVSNWARWICGDDGVRVGAAGGGDGPGTAGAADATVAPPKWRGDPCDSDALAPAPTTAASAVDAADTAPVAYGAPRDVYSQLILPTNSSSLPVICTSIDPDVVPQSEGRLEQFHDIVNNRSRRRLSGFLTKRASGGSGMGGSCTGGGLGSAAAMMMLNGNGHGSTLDFYREPSLPTSWDRVPGLAELRRNKLGATMRVNSKFRMIRYSDQLQRTSEEYVKPGNVYFAFKCARWLSEEVIQVLVQATAGKNSPNNESRIFVTSLGCAINDVPEGQTACDSRDVNFAIFIEGRWSDSRAERRAKRERGRVVKWVHWVSGQLALCDGIRSTAHPEAALDRLPRLRRGDGSGDGGNDCGDGDEAPPKGHCNFRATNGRRLVDVKRRRDPRNVFSMASRVTWRDEEDPELAEVDGASGAEDIYRRRKRNGNSRPRGGTCTSKEGDESSGASCLGDSSAPNSPDGPIDLDESDDSDADGDDDDDEEEEDDDDEECGGSENSRDSDEQPLCLHYTSQRDVAGSLVSRSARSMHSSTDIESVDEGRSPVRVAVMDPHGVGASSSRSGFCSLKTNSARSVRSTGSDFESDRSDFGDDTGINSRYEKSTHFSKNCNVAYDFDESSECSTPAKSTRSLSVREDEENSTSSETV